MNPQLSQNIAVDCDGVLSKTVEAILAYNDYKFAGKELKYEQVLHHNFHEIPGFEYATKQQAIDIFNSFLGNPDLHMTIDPVEYALESLQYFKDQGHGLYLVTARPDALKKITIDWLDQNFPHIFTDIYCIDHKMMSGDTTKSSICFDIGAKTIIEDAPYNAMELADSGIYTFMPRRPWNKLRLEDNPTYPNIQPIYSREEVG